MAAKRPLDQDPEYDAIPAEIQEKRIKVLEDNVRKQTEKKIEAIIKSNFDQEIAKQHETIDNIDELLHEGRCMMDRLRACAITKYYANFVQEQVPNEHATAIHPTVKKYLSKSPRKIDSCSVDNPIDSHPDSAQTKNKECQDFQFNNQIQMKQESNQSPSKTEEVSTRAPRFKRRCKIIVGNISKFIPLCQRDASDKSTHKWMVYVRGDNNHPNIESFVKKVIFLLHPSYSPSDIVEISNPPFHLIKRGWGEFPVRVQLHFHDPRNKAVDIIHYLKLDKTFTGLQTLGAETVVEVQLFKPDESKVNSTNSTIPLMSSSKSSLISIENNTTVACNGPTSVQGETQNMNTFVHSIIKKEPDSLVMNIKLPKPISSDVIPSNVNNHKIISKSNDCSQPLNSIESNSEKKTVPKIVIANNKVTTKGSVTKPIPIVNGVSATVLCKEGKVLLVPQSSLTLISPNTAKQISIPQSNAEVNNVNLTVENNVNKIVPSCIFRLVSDQDSGKTKGYFIPLSENKSPSSQVKSPIDSSSELSSKLDKREKSEIVSKSLSFIKKAPHSHYEQELDSIKLGCMAEQLHRNLNCICSKCNKQQVCVHSSLQLYEHTQQVLEYYKSFVDLLKRVCKIFPLVKKGADRSVFTFCAESLEEFHTWNIGKQRASEWRRAGMVRKAIINLFNKKESPHLTSDSIWSQSSIMSWCRKNGFVPMATEKITLLPEPKWSGVELCSLTNPDDLVSSLTEEKHTIVTSDDEEIDVVNIHDEKKTDNTTTVQQEACYLPHFTDAAVYVKQIASQLGIDIKPIEVEPKLYAPAIEEMIVSICQQLASDIIGSSLNEGFNRLGGKICPEEITVSDVYSAIKNNAKYDIFSNSCLGIPKDSPENT